MYKFSYARLTVCSFDLDLDLDLDPMTAILDLELDIVRIYQRTAHDACGSMHSNVRAKTDTHRHTQRKALLHHIRTL